MTNISTIEKEFDEKLMGENGWLLEQGGDYCDEIKAFLRSSIEQALEATELAIDKFPHDGCEGDCFCDANLWNDAVIVQHQLISEVMK